MKKRVLSLLIAMATLSISSFGIAVQAATMGQEIVDYAKEWIHTPYKRGGTDLSSGVDCSGFVCRVYEHFGIDLWGRRGELRRLADDGVATEIGTDLSLAQPGDIITCYDGGHVAIYAGNGCVVQASSKHGVCESPATYAWLGNVISIIRINAVSGTVEPTATIQPGLYNLVPMCALGRCLDVKGEYPDGWMDAQIWQSNGAATQQWNIEPLDGGYYKLTVRATGKVLDVANAETTSGTNVQQCIWTNNYAQHWRFTDAGDGYYHITTRLDANKRLDVNERKDANGTNVQIWEANNETSQKWKLIPVKAAVETNTTDQSAVSGQAIVDYAKQWIGTPYVWGGTSLTNGADCSGFVCRVYEHFGFNLWKRRTGLRRLVDDGVAIELGTDLSQAQPGDIITCNGGKHVVIYAGNDRVVQSTSGKGICESSARLSNVISMIRIKGVSNTAVSQPDPSTATTTTETQQTPQVTEYFDCDIYIYTTAGQTVNAYANIFDAKRKNWFDKGQILRCQKGAKGSDGSTWYQTHAVNARNEQVTLWVNAGSPGITIEEIEPEPSCEDGHTWEGWKTTREASCTQSGKRERVCSVCGTSQEELISSLGHDYRESRETDTAIVYTCTNCGASYTENKPEPKTEDVDMGPFVPIKQYLDGMFRDVDAGDWFSGNVAAAYELGLMKGTGERAFSPGNNVTLAEGITLAARVHSIYHTGAENFPSYDGGNWYDPYVNYARENGIISTNYVYTQPATREEFVHILAQALPEEALADIAGAISFADSSSITYIGDVTLLSGAGVINGVEENGAIYFKPGATITRAEAAAIVGRMAQPGTRIGA